MVRPMMIKKISPLAGVSDVFNAVLVTGDSLGDAMFYGRGAGKLATASAVMADVIDCVRHKEIQHPIKWVEDKTDFVKPIEESCARFMVRLAKKSDAEIFDNAQTIEIDNFVCVITDVMSEKELREKIKSCDALSVIRVLEV